MFAKKNMAEVEYYFIVNLITGVIKLLIYI